ncbi:hypothetical protein A6A03_07345 [Chloroflexus islandicus]|uniref:DUF2470 domain-containing protein n=1 Tax=Chloroflexus islandicus TaxID=1707952 RepID=A0A178MIN5_9CHLR|nr:DUF2470 domain-containing protein [Chloroflexus islandicus]OAN48582.1 hypothetical protein A6A03_07345 [Chloroflexus islandicus]
MSDEHNLPATFVSGVIAHINHNHRQELLDLAHGLANQRWAEEADLLSVDRHGIALTLRAEGRVALVRFTFDRPIEKPNQFRPALIALIEQARINLKNSNETGGS